MALTMEQYDRQFVYTCQKCGKRYECFTPPKKRCKLCGGKLKPPTKDYILHGDK